MKRLSTVALAVALVLVVGAAPALADRPVTETEDFSFTAPNPCGGIHTLTFHIEWRIHEHGDKLIVTAKRSGSTSDGFVLVNGTQVWVNNGHVQSNGVNDIWYNEATGERFRVWGWTVFNFETGTLQMDRFSPTCLGSQHA
jgi:hypothetical protein